MRRCTRAQTDGRTDKITQRKKNGQTDWEVDRQGKRVEHFDIQVDSQTEKAGKADRQMNSRTDTPRETGTENSFLV